MPYRRPGGSRSSITSSSGAIFQKGGANFEVRKHSIFREILIEPQKTAIIPLLHYHPTEPTGTSVSPANATAEISLVDGDIIYKLNGTTVRTIATSYTTFYTHFNAYNGGVADDIYVQAPAIQAPIPDGQGIIDHILFLNTVVPR